MSPSMAPAMGMALLAWTLSLARPGWTRRLAARLRRRWRVWLVPAAGVASIAAADQLMRLAPSGLLALGHRALVAPGLFPRVILVALLALPVVADAALQPGGARTLLARAGRGLAAALAWGALPAAAACWVGHAYAGVWSRVLGGELAPAAQRVALVLLGADAPPGARATPDPALAGAVNAMALAALAVFLCLYCLPWLSWLSFPLGTRSPFGVGRAGFSRLGWRSRGLEPTADTPASKRLLAALTVWLTSPLATTLLLGAILLLGFNLRWQFFVDSNAAVTGLSADGQSYFDEALTLGPLAQQRGTNLAALFFSGSTWFREPLFIYLLQGWLRLLGPQEVHAMYFTIVASLAWTAVAVAAIWALLGRWPALLAGLLIAIDDTWIRNAVVGLREEVTGLFLVSTVVVLFARWARARSLHWLAPLLVAAAALTRLDALPFGLFLLGWAAVAQRWRWHRLALTAALCGAILAPTFLGYATTRGDAAPAATVIATNNWIDEFRDRLGEPGFEPDRKVSAFEYLFHYHTPLQVAWYTARGAVIIYHRFVFFPLHYRLAAFSYASGRVGRPFGLEWQPLVPLIFVAGCLALLAQYRRWRTYWLPVALCVVGVLPPIGFSAGVPDHLMYQARYGYLVAPFAFGVFAWTICTAGALLVRYARRLRVADRAGVPALAPGPSPHLAGRLTSSLVTHPPSPAADGRRGAR